MNMLIVGSGAREHAIAAALKRSPQKPKIHCYGNSSNPGIRELCLAYHVGNITNVKEIAKYARNWQIDIAIIGPEAPLEKGLADILWRQGIKTIGPKQQLAQIETSKAFARELMEEYNIPGLPRFRNFKEMTGAAEFLAELGENHFVIKANGLMGGKGVKVAGEHLFAIDEALTYAEEILREGQSLVIEEKLIGQEFSLMCFCDGENVIPMPIVQDHKRAFVDDKGPNTGGMGSYTDSNHSLPFLTTEDVAEALQINKAIVAALSKKLNEKYIGVLYGGFMATRDGVYVIEFNARFGDPEALNVLTLLETDFVAICKAQVSGQLSTQEIKFSSLATVCKYTVPIGYPDKPVKNAMIDIAQVKNTACLYLASVHAEENKLITLGSRTAAFVGVAETIAEAEIIAEKEVRHINGPLFHREDIGTQQLIQKRIEAMETLRAFRCA